MASKEIQEFTKAINALALELPEAVWNDFHFMWIQLQNHLSPTPGVVTAEAIENDFRAIISHALLGCDTDGISKETWDLVFSECQKYASLMCASKDAALAEKEAAVRELVSAVTDNDALLRYFEDFTHGGDGENITKQRGSNQKLIDKYGS